MALAFVAPACLPKLPRQASEPAAQGIKRFGPPRRQCLALLGTLCTTRRCRAESVLSEEQKMAILKARGPNLPVLRGDSHRFS